MTCPICRGTGRERREIELGLYGYITRTRRCDCLWTAADRDRERQAQDNWRAREASARDYADSMMSAGE